MEKWRVREWGVGQLAGGKGAGLREVEIGKKDEGRGRK